MASWVKFENGKSIVISVLDETDLAYIYTKGSADDVTLALYQLFNTVSKLGDSGLFCESFAEMLSCENAENLYNSIKNRADFDCFHEEFEEEIEDTSDRIRYINNDEDWEKIHKGDFSFLKKDDTMKIIVRKPTDKEITVMKTKSIWSREISEFDWHYNEEEICLVIEGEVVVKYGSKSVSFATGDLVVFPKGLSCVWQVKKPVKKYYVFQ